MQLLTSPQLPQPSQTSSLITANTLGSAWIPRLRWRRFSAAHCWSLMRTVTPAVASSSLSESKNDSRPRSVAIEAKRAPRQRRGCSETTMIFCTPSAAMLWVSSGIPMLPWASWPPVMATAPL